VPRCRSRSCLFDYIRCYGCLGCCYVGYVVWLYVTVGCYVCPLRLRLRLRYTPVAVGCYAARLLLQLRLVGCGLRTFTLRCPHTFVRLYVCCPGCLRLFVCVARLVVTLLLFCSHTFTVAFGWVHTLCNVAVDCTVPLRWITVVAPRVPGYVTRITCCSCVPIHTLPALVTLIGWFASYVVVTLRSRCVGCGLRLRVWLYVDVRLFHSC